MSFKKGIIDPRVSQIFTLSDPAPTYAEFMDSFADGIAYAQGITINELLKDMPERETDATGVTGILDD